MFPVLLSLALYEPTLLPGGGVALPNSLGTLVSTFSGRAFGADAPGAGSEWQVAPRLHLASLSLEFPGVSARCSY